jgi:hypothetical protein
MTFIKYLIAISLIVSCGRYEHDHNLERSCNDKCSNDSQDLYIKSEDLKTYELTVINGRFYHHDGRLAEARGIYVLSPDEKLYFKNLDTDKGRTFFHSYFLRGSRVLCAGWMIFKDGNLVLINNNSGHYAPTAKNFFLLLRFLAKNRVNLEDTEKQLK